MMILKGQLLSLFYGLCSNDSYIPHVKDILTNDKQRYDTSSTCQRKLIGKWDIIALSSSNSNLHLDRTVSSTKKLIIDEQYCGNFSYLNINYSLRLGRKNISDPFLFNFVCEDLLNKEIGMATLHLNNNMIRGNLTIGNNYLTFQAMQSDISIQNSPKKDRR